MLSNILLSKLNPHKDKIFTDDECGFQHNRSTTDQICFCIHQIPVKEGYNETVHQLFIDFKKAYDSMRWEVLHDFS
jgi:hypothetical protein